MKNHNSVLNIKREKILELNNERAILKQTIKEKDNAIKTNLKMIQLKNNKLNFYMNKLKKIHHAFYNYAFKYSLIIKTLKNHPHMDHFSEHVFSKFKDWRSFVEHYDNVEFEEWKNNEIKKDAIEDVKKNFNEFIMPDLDLSIF